MRNINKKNIAIIVPTLKNGGAERIASNLSLSISELYNVHIIVNNTSNGDYLYRGTLHDLKSKSHNNLILKVFSIISRTYKLRKIKKINKINISISLLTSSNFMNLLSGTGDRSILTIHSIMSKANNKSLYHRLKNLLIRNLYGRADKIIAVSEGAKLSLSRNYNLEDEHVSVINNMFDIPEINELSKEGLSQLESEFFEFPVIINVGRLSKVKGQWHLIRAFKMVKDKYSDVKLIILGMGELENELKKLVLDFGLEDDVKFIGFTNNPFKYISRSTILASTSIRESFGNAIIEAMACGVPVISTDCMYGPREILHPSSNMELRTDVIECAPYGVLTPVGEGNFYSYNKTLTHSEELLAESIIQLLSSKEKREYYKSAGLLRAKDFMSDVIVKKWVEEVFET